MGSVLPRTLGFSIAAPVQMNRGRSQNALEHATQVNECSFIDQSKFQELMLNGYQEIDSGWANLFQCNTSTDLLTCNHEYTSAGIVCNGNGVGTYDGYTSANVTAAQVGITDDATRTNTTNTTSTTYNGSTDTGSSKTTVTTCPSTTSSKSNSELLVLGIGLGAGLGVPLLIATGLLIYCSGQNRKQKKEIQRISEIAPTVRPQTLRADRSKRAELYTSFVYPELEGSNTGKMELPGSCPSYKY